MENSSNKLPSQNNTKPCVEIVETVRYSETDKMGVAHNKCYFEWFEIGRTTFCREKGFPYRNIEDRGFYLVVVEAFCRYRKPLRYDEKFIIRTSLQELSPKKARFSYELVTIEKRELIAAGYTVHISTDAGSKVTPLPPDILTKLES